MAIIVIVNDQSVFAWGQVGRFQFNTNINDTGLIQQIKSISHKTAVVVMKASLHTVT